MNKPSVSVETTIPSFYQEERTALDIVVRREWIRQWWDGAFERYEWVTRVAVLGELPAVLKSAWSNGWPWFAICHFYPLSWPSARYASVHPS